MAPVESAFVDETMTESTERSTGSEAAKPLPATFTDERGGPIVGPNVIVGPYWYCATDTAAELDCPSAAIAATAASRATNATGTHTRKDDFFMPSPPFRSSVRADSSSRSS